MTIILFALLCNWDRAICLIDVGTEGSGAAHGHVRLADSAVANGAALVEIRIVWERTDGTRLRCIRWRHTSSWFCSIRAIPSKPALRRSGERSRNFFLTTPSRERTSRVTSQRGRPSQPGDF